MPITCCLRSFQQCKNNKTQTVETNNSENGKIEKQWVGMSNVKGGKRDKTLIQIQSLVDSFWFHFNSHKMKIKQNTRFP